METVLSINTDDISCSLTGFINCFTGDDAEKFIELCEQYFNEKGIDYTRVKSIDDVVETQVMTMRNSEVPNYEDAIDYFNNGYNVVLSVGTSTNKFAANYTIQNVDGHLVAVKN